MKEWTVQISRYSLAQNEVGKLLDEEPIRRVHDNPVAALLDLEQAIEHDEGSGPLIGQSFVIITPEAHHLPLDAVYTATFNVDPVRHSNKLNTYPALRKAARKLKKKLD
jgi:hypothetical protein